MAAESLEADGSTSALGELNRRVMELASTVSERQYQPMADEPENLTLKLLREIRAEQTAMREDITGLRNDMTEVRAEQHALASLLGKVSDAVTAVAALQERHSEILARHSELLGEILETQRSHGGRLNIIDGRLAILERHAGLVKA